MPAFDCAVTDPLCRLCGAPLRHSLVDLGCTPLANSFITAEQAARGEDRAYPLHARVCERCLLVQVEQAVPAEAIFSDYAYFSSFSSSWVAQIRVSGWTQVTPAARRLGIFGGRSGAIDSTGSEFRLSRIKAASQIRISRRASISQASYDEVCLHDSEAACQRPATFKGEFSNLFFYFLQGLS